MSMAVAAYQPTYGNAFGWGQPQWAPAPVPPQAQMGWDQYQPVYGQPPAFAQPAPYAPPLQYAPPVQYGPPANAAPAQPSFAQSLSSLWDRIASALGFGRQAPQAGPMPQAVPQNPGLAQVMSAPDDVSFVTGLYRQLLGREPDQQGFAGYVNAMRTGLSRQDAINSFMASPEYQQRQSWLATTGGAPQAAPGWPAAGVPSAPPIAEASLHQIVISAAQRAMAQMPGPVARLNQQPLISRQQENQTFYDLTSLVIAELAAKGLPVERLARHTQFPVGDPSRYVNDAIVLPDGRAIDMFGGDGTLAQFHDLSVPNPITDRYPGGSPRGVLPSMPASAIPTSVFYAERLPLLRWGTVVHNVVRNETSVMGPIRVGDRVVLDTTPHVANPDPSDPRRVIEQPKNQQDPRGPLFRQISGPPLRMNEKTNPYLIACHPTVPGTYEVEVWSRDGAGQPGRVSFTVER